MNEPLVARLRERFARWPDGVGGGVSLEAVVAAESKLQAVFPEDYKRFLTLFGSAIVGSLPIFGLSDPPYGVDYHVTEASEHFRRLLPADYERFVVVSVDLGGNPVGFLPDASTIVCYDHDFGGRHEEAPTFSAFLEQLLS